VPDASRTVLVTGGTGGLGVAVVEAFMEHDWRVVVPWIYEQEVERVGERPGVELVRADLYDPDDVARAVRAATGHEGAPLKALANLVGGYHGPGKVADAPLADFERMFELNLKPTYLVTQAVIPHLVAAGGGAIVCVSSRAGVMPFAGAAGYCAAKAAVLAFAKAVHAEYAAEGVRCNAVLPSRIGTPHEREIASEAEQDVLVPPEQVARAIRFLCSEDSAATGGAGVPVYGRA
jgi:NAD(P)-dependent dehydrogenase (short-subunit alcohol dehydrogenase family)